MTRQGLVDVCDGCDIGFKAMLEGSGSDSEGELGHAQIGQGSHAHLGQISHPHFGQSNHGHVNHSNAVMPFADNAITAESMDEYGGGRDALEALPTCASRRAIARARQSSRQSRSSQNCKLWNLRQQTQRRVLVPQQGGVRGHDERSHWPVRRHERQARPQR